MGWTGHDTKNNKKKRVQAATRCEMMGNSRLGGRHCSPFRISAFTAAPQPGLPAARTRVGLRGPVRRPRVTPGGTAGRRGRAGLHRSPGRVPPIRSSPEVLVHHGHTPSAPVPAGGIRQKIPLLHFLPFFQHFFWEEAFDRTQAEQNTAGLKVAMGPLQYSKTHLLGFT